MHSAALRPLRIVNRRASEKNTNENIMSVGRGYLKPISSYGNGTNSSSAARNIGLSSYTTGNKMLDAPNYKFPRIYEHETDILFPIYTCRIDTDQKNLRMNEIKVDFTADMNIQKNITKKYSKPIEVGAIEPKRLFQKNETQQAASSSNIFFRCNTTTNNEDPIMDCFVHMKSENQLRFGDLVLTIGKDGSVSSMHTPEKEEGNAILLGRGSANERDFNEEVLYASDEGEGSRLENSDLDLTDSEESDVELDLDLELRDGADDEDEELMAGDLSIINSSLISQGVPPCSMNNLQNGFLTNDRKQKSATSHMPLSPVKKAMLNNQDNTACPSSPQKQDLLFRTLKNKSSPVKALRSQRSGVNLTQVSKPKKNKHTNYAKWDNSMTISAKAIMKMVDDSLVSSDTELYNHSHSFLAMRSLGKGNHTHAKDDGLNINAADLIGALSGEVDSPLTRRMKELKLQ
ncbi:hypothetical protein PMKS-002800 [Pichia membranifaciens]|uniref:Uncharacterized protein n=1 Tax=Pichia membranifaciens TaxID=4926 RepID=A0A1Q2YIE0_9ASCO|nr:hypothetical protein PMKS-002800 [Pichia membranifaciens]